uniref:Uncharacterized protein n=1 Tax=Arundo donax TaxID=35708 RepID=A0A0A9DXN8_ARUDO
MSELIVTLENFIEWKLRLHLPLKRQKTTDAGSLGIIRLHLNISNFFDQHSYVIQTTVWLRELFLRWNVGGKI